MATAANDRFRIVLLLGTLAACAFFLAQGATALFSAQVLSQEPEDVPIPSGRAVAPTLATSRHDPNVILQRNIFDSAQGDLTDVPLPDPALPDEDIPLEEVETPCKSTMRLVGTVVLPGDFERSLAAIVGEDQKVALHQGGAEVEGSRIRAIQSDSVILQTNSGFCRLAMFEVEGGAKPIAPPVAAKRDKPVRRGPSVDRNAGLSDEEIAEGIEKVNDTNYNLSRTMLNKVLDNAGRLIGIAAVSPKIENGQSVGLEIRGIRPDTLLTKLGLENGDILEAVNGQPLGSPDAALGAYTTLRTADKFNLSIRRNGQSMMMNYNLQ
ncbi:MAG TPA: type II secretion system protein GspC [Polyangiales bacterium]|nr:type II secretion system protein GspC [Polyangiales bacterium]